jgi:tetratricopeptide (TPR) repeat protein
MNWNSLKTIFTKNQSKSNDYDETLTELNLVLEKEPNNIEAYIKRSKIKRKLKDEIGANQDMETANTLLKKLDRGIESYDTGLAKLNTDDYEEAIKYFSDAILNDVSTSGTYYYRGLAKEYNGNYREALPDYNKAIEIKADYVEAYYDRAKLKFHQLNDIQGALDDFNKAIQLNPNDDKVYVSRAILKKSISDVDGAMKDFDRAIEINPLNAEAYFSRSILKFRTEDYVGTIKDLDNVIKNGLPADASVSMFDAYFLRGNVKHIVADYENAIQDFNKAIQLNGNEGKVYYERSEAYLANKQFDKAAADKAKALELGYEEEN